MSKRKFGRVVRDLLVAVTGGVLVGWILGLIPTPFRPDRGTPTPTPTTEPTRVTPVAIAQPTTESEVIFEENFEDGRADGLRWDQGWQVVYDGAGNKVLETSSMYDPALRPAVSFGPAAFWGDYAVGFRVKLLEIDSSDTAGQGPGLIYLNFREKDGRKYILSMPFYWHSIGFYVEDGDLNTRWEELANGSSEYNFQPDRWYSIRLEARDKYLKAYVDDRLVLEVEDSRLSIGSLSLQTGPNTLAQFDDIQVSR